KYPSMPGQFSVEINSQFQASNALSDQTVPQVHQTILKLPHFTQLELLSTVQPLEMRLSCACKEGVHYEPDFVDQSGVDQARCDLRPANEINVLAGQVLELGHFVDSAEEARVRPERGLQRR